MQLVQCANAHQALPDHRAKLKLMIAHTILIKMEHYV